MSTNNDATDNQLIPYEMVIEDAVKKALSGQNADAVLETLLSQLPARLREAVNRRFQQRLEAARSGLEKPKEKPAVGKMAQFVFSMSAVANLVTQVTLNRIRQLIQSRPDIAGAIAREGNILAKNGVTPDMVTVTEEGLGNLITNVAKDQTKEKDAISR